MICKEKNGNNSIEKLIKSTSNVLSKSLAYNLLQNFLLNKSSVQGYVNSFICPFPRAKILDLGCGTGNILKYLPENINYVGYDINPDYIFFAKGKYKNKREFYCEDINNIEIKNKNFDIVLATGVLHHLEDKKAKKLSEIAFSSLKNGGHLLTIDNVYFERQSKIEKYFISLDRGEFVRTKEQYLDLIKCIFPKVETFFLNGMLKIPYTHFIMKCLK